MRSVSIILSFLIFTFLNLHAKSNLSDKAKIYNKVKESVVLVKTFYGFDIFDAKAQNQATGFFIREDGYLITSNKILGNISGINVYVNQNNTVTRYPAYIVKQDSDNGLAVLKVNDASTTFTTIEAAGANTLRQAEEILVFGYSGASVKSDELNVSWGILSSDPDEDLLQTSATINPGNYGGPALNIDGKAIGIVTSKKVSLNEESIGYLTSIKYVWDILDGLAVESDEDEFFGASDFDAYAKLCEAVDYLEASGDREVDSAEISKLNHATGLLCHAIKLDKEFVSAYYFLADYYLRLAGIYCEAGDLERADSIAIVAADMLDSYPSKWGKFDAYMFNRSNPASSLWDDECIDCDMWEQMKNYIQNYEDMSQYRINDFFDYLNDGDSPELLQDALEGRQRDFSLNTTKRNSQGFNNNFIISNEFVFQPGANDGALRTSCLSFAYVPKDLIEITIGAYYASEYKYSEYEGSMFKIAIDLYNVILEMNMPVTGCYDVPKYTFGYNNLLSFKTDDPRYKLSFIWNYYEKPHDSRYNDDQLGIGVRFRFPIFQPVISTISLTGHDEINAHIVIGVVL